MCSLLMNSTMLPSRRDTCKLQAWGIHKVRVKKKWTHVCVYYENYDQFRQKSFITAKSRHPEDSKLVRQVHVVQ